MALDRRHERKKLQKISWNGTQIREKGRKGGNI